MQFNKANAKGPCRSKKNQNLFSTPYQQATSSYFSWSRTSACLVIASETDVITSAFPASSTFLSAFMAELMWSGIEYPSGQFRSAILALCPLRILTTPSLLLKWILERLPWGCSKHCSSAARILVSYQQLPSSQVPIHSITVWGLLCGKLAPSQPDPIHHMK